VLHTSGIDVSAGNFTIVTIASLVVTPANLTLPLNSRQRFQAIATNSDGSTQNIGANVAWSSSNTAVGTIDATGVLTAVTGGQTSVGATFGSFASSTSLTIQGRSFVPVSNLNQIRANHTATLLPSGKVLIAGGYGGYAGSNDFGPLSTAEIYDPTAKSFSLIGMNAARESHTATILQNGKVLIVGGLTPAGSGFTQALTSAEIYDPSTGAFTLTGSLSTPRFNHTATLLPNGKVLVVGGGGAQPQGLSVPITSAEVYDPVAGTFSPTGSLSVQRVGSPATLLNDGTVFFAGGTDFLSVYDATSDIYNPANGTFSPGQSLPTSQYNHSATLLANGSVLFAGGTTQSLNTVPWANATVYNPSTGTFTPTASLALARENQTATTLGDGTVLVIGGENSSLDLTYDTAEYYNPTSQVFVGAGSTVIYRQGHTATLLNDGTVLVVGGNLGDTTVEAYEPTLPAPVTLQLSPASARLIDGATQQFVALDQLGHQRLDATWTVSNPGVATIPSDSTPTVTAVSPGQMTLTANVDGVVAQAVVTVAPASLQITPATVTLLIGNITQFSVVDELGRPSPIATWTVSSPGVASITADSSPTVTGLATGQVTLTASVEGVSAQGQVNISGLSAFVDGTVLWSTPPVPGFSLQQFAYAVPTSSSPDIYTVLSSADGTQTIVQALNAAGQQRWQDQIPAVANGAIVPDFFGGLVAIEACNAVTPMTIVDLNPVTGTANWQIPFPLTVNGQTICLQDVPKVTVRHDGAVAMTMPLQISPRIFVLDGTSGATLSNPPIPASTTTDINGNVTSCDCATPVGPPIVGPDGSIYVEYEVRQIPYPPTTLSSALRLLKIALDGTTTTTPISSSTSANLFPGTLMPDGSGGVVATWTIVPPTFPPAPVPYQAADISSSGIVTTYPLSLAPTQVVNGSNGLPVNPELVLGEGSTGFYSFGGSAVAFNVGSGTVIYNYAPAQTGVSILSATAGNGLVVATNQAGAQNVVNLDNTGAVTTTSTAGAGGHFSWRETWNALFSGGIGGIYKTPLPLANSFWAMPGGNGSGNGMAVQQVQTNQTQGLDEQLPFLTPPPPIGCILNYAAQIFVPTCGNTNAIELLTNLSTDAIFQQYIQTFAPVAKTSASPNSVMYVETYNNPTVPVNVTQAGQVLQISLRGINSLLQDPFFIMTERVDTVNHVVSVVTLTGHPLAGWRYWRVYSIGTTESGLNDVVVETGAYDQPGPGIKNYAGYFIAKHDVVEGWREYLRFIQAQLGASQGSALNNTLGGIQIIDFYPGQWEPPTLVDGYYDYGAFLTNYILNNVCQSTTCH
jgi:hypothetical protein